MPKPFVFLETERPEDCPTARVDAETILDAEGVSPSLYEAMEDLAVFAWLEELGYHWAGCGGRPTNPHESHTFPPFPTGRGWDYPT